MQTVDVADVEPPPLIRDNSGFVFLHQRSDSWWMRSCLQQFFPHYIIQALCAYISLVVVSMSIVYFSLQCFLVSSSVCCSRQSNFFLEPFNAKGSSLKIKELIGCDDDVLGKSTFALILGVCVPCLFGCKVIEIAAVRSTFVVACKVFAAVVFFLWSLSTELGVNKKLD